jgi:UDP-GlcNAc:undecaprenyl-phosphate GlcNAc-1-phosphate transferase
VAVAAVAPVRWSPFGPFAVVVAVVVLMNAVNMLDGLDALAASVALVGAAGFALVLRHDDRTVAIALAGALLGFLWFNRPPARVYLGDAGAYLLGTALALLFALAWHPHREISEGVAAIALVALPVMETIITVLRRRRARRPLFVGDRGHVYDQLVDRGWNATRASLGFALVETALAVVAVAVTHAAAAVATALVALAVLLPLVGAIATGFTRPGVEEPS